GSGCGFYVRGARLVHRLFANCLEIAREFIFSRRALRGVSEITSAYYGQLSGKPLDYIPRAIFLPACTEFAWLRIVRESVANRWKIGQENSLGHTRVKNSSSFRVLLVGCQ